MNDDVRYEIVEHRIGMGDAFNAGFGWFFSVFFAGLIVSLVSCLLVALLVLMTGNKLHLWG
jgi:hypothetical protein